MDLNKIFVKDRSVLSLNVMVGQIKQKPAYIFACNNRTHLWN